VTPAPPNTIRVPDLTGSAVAGIGDPSFRKTCPGRANRSVYSAIDRPAALMAWRHGA
jgi:hypothetical protein